MANAMLDGGGGDDDDHVSNVITTIFLVASHLFLLPSVAWTWRRRRWLWIEFSVVSSILVWSLAYHTCYETNICVFSRKTHRVSDHFFATLCIPMTIFYLARVDSVRVKGLFIVFVMHVQFVIDQLLPATGLVSKVVIFAACACLATLHAIIDRSCVGRPTAASASSSYYNDSRLYTHTVCVAREHHMHRVRCCYFDEADSVLGIVLCLAGVVVFIVSDDVGDTNYFLSHSIWHLLSFCGLYFVFESRNKRRTLLMPAHTWNRTKQAFVRLFLLPQNTIETKQRCNVREIVV